jgi:hypothetical protein
MNATRELQRVPWTSPIETSLPKSSTVNATSNGASNRITR